MLAICIGVASVSTVSAFGSAADLAIQKEIDKIGIDGVIYYRAHGGTISNDAVQTIKKNDSVSAAMVFSMNSGGARLQNVQTSAGILGIDETLDQVMKITVLHGRLPKKSQIVAGEAIAVVDSDLAQKAYHRTNVVGKRIKIKFDGITEIFKICAVIESQSSGLSAIIGSQLPHLIYVPNTALKRIYGKIETELVLTAFQTENQKAHAEQLSAQLEKEYGEPYQFENLNAYLNSFLLITKTVSILIAGIAAISVLVGGIGVMNAMISSVEVRIKEIGIYRALGCRKHDIAKLFLAEAIMLCAVGGTLGVLTSKLIFEIIRLKIPFALQFDWKPALLGLCISAGSGILFGLLPAVRASKLDPITAMHAER